MVSSVSGVVPYSYLDQLTGGTTPTDVTTPATTPAATSATSTDSSSDSASTDTSTDNSTSTTNPLGLPPEVLTLLQSIGGDSSVASLLNPASSTANPVSQLVGDNTPSADNFIASQDSALMNVQVSSGLYQAALNGAAMKKSQAAHATDPLQNILAAYNATLNQNNPPPVNTVNTTS